MIRSVKLPWGTIQYEFERKRIKNINLRIRADRSVYVSAPIGVPLRVIENFIISKSDFIRSAVSRSTQPSDCVFRDGDTIRLFGSDVVVSLSKSSTNKVSLSDGTLFVSLKEPDDEKKRTLIVQRYLNTLAKEYLTEVFDDIFPLFARYKIEKPSLYFRSAKTRWGSCCAQKASIMLNVRLIHYPRKAAEYVAAHELSHMMVQNHSKDFYDILSSVMPDYKERRKILKG